MSKRIAVIVGVGPGLGTALTREFVDNGLTVVAAARHAASLEALASFPSQSVFPRDCDATSSADVSELFAFTAELGSIELAVFNAGAFTRTNVVDTDPEEFERCWRVGCLAGLHVGQEAAKRMTEEGRGTIIFTGATASLRGGPGFVNLASPKFALRALAQSMARELAPGGIHVAHVIIDGQIRAPRYEAQSDERGPDSLLEPQAIAQQYLVLHQQHRSAWTHELDLRPWVERF